MQLSLRALSLRAQANRRSLLLALVPFALYVLALYYAKTHYYRDITSEYFDASRAYDRIYSDVRQKQAADFVQQSEKAVQHRSSSPKACVGMLTLARPTGVIYFRNALASLLVGLTPEEREELYIMPFVTHTKPEEHPVYAEEWLHRVSDRVLTYKEMPADQLKHIQELEAERTRTGVPDREKHLSDYTYLLQTCLSLNASYIIMFEDDVIAMDGWWQRTKQAIKEVELQSIMQDLGDFFYLRLFYTERSHERWTAHQKLVYPLSCLAISLVVSTYIVYLSHNKRVSKTVRNHSILFMLIVNLSVLLTAKYFMTLGLLTLRPMPHGVRKMPTGGCCAQGVVYPASRIPTLIEWYKERHIGFVDTLAEELADKNEVGLRWAMVPSVIQHVGSQSSKGDNWGTDKPGQMSEAEQLWNFEFELNDADKLRKQHEKMVSKKEKLSDLDRNHGKVFM